MDIGIQGILWLLMKIFGLKLGKTSQATVLSKVGHPRIRLPRKLHFLKRKLKQK
jgi:hypothetical protein